MYNNKIILLGNVCHIIAKMIFIIIEVLAVYFIIFCFKQIKKTSRIKII